jgi:hypothetical protein
LSRVRNALALVVTLCCAPGAAADLARQSPAGRLNVFLDCQDCFQDFIRNEITFVDYVRDRADAHVHIIVTREPTGAGGQERAVQFIGLARFRGVDQTLRSSTISGESEDQIRRRLVTTIKVGLLRYLIETPAAERLDVGVEVGAGASRPAGADDRWNNWVFAIESGAGVQAEESTREVDLGLEAGADRVTHDWKISVGAELEYNTERFDLEEEGSVRSIRRERELRGLVVRSLGEHWSIGGTAELESSTFRNTELAAEFAPAIEYNAFPYSAYTRRQLRVLYAVGARRVRYLEETLFGRTEETLGEQELSITLEQRERWGTLRSRAEMSHYLHEASKHRLEVEGGLSFRVMRGLSVNLDASASRVRDQLSLPRRGATPEEVLLRQRQLRSNYEYQLSFGFRYTFGSIYSSIVNPRFGQ